MRRAIALKLANDAKKMLIVLFCCLRCYTIHSIFIDQLSHISWSLKFTNTASSFSPNTAKKNVLIKYEQMHSSLRIWSHLLKKSLRWLAWLIWNWQMIFSFLVDLATVPITLLQANPIGYCTIIWRWKRIINVNFFHHNLSIMFPFVTQLAITCSKLTAETLE